MSNIKLLIAVVFFNALLISPPVLAYLDPGTGSLVIQTIIGAIAAVGVTLKIYWHKLRVLFGGKPEPETAEDDNNEISP